MGGNGYPQYERFADFIDLHPRLQGNRHPQQELITDFIDLHPSRPYGRLVNPAAIAFPLFESLSLYIQVHRYGSWIGSAYIKPQNQSGLQAETELIAPQFVRRADFRVGSGSGHCKISVQRTSFIN